MHVYMKANFWKDLHIAFSRIKALKSQYNNHLNVSQNKFDVGLTEMLFLLLVLPLSLHLAEFPVMKNKSYLTNSWRESTHFSVDSWPFR